MSLNEQLERALSEINALDACNTFSAKDIISVIDLTLLNSEATPNDINALVSKANQEQVAAVCLLPVHLKSISLTGQVKLATVLNFPKGNEPLKDLLKQLEHICSYYPIDEIDYVFPYQRYLMGQEDEALMHCQEIYTCCKKNNLLFKVILETSALPSTDAVYTLSRAILKQGCDFIKTSTGKLLSGATLPAAFAMLLAIIDSESPAGIKVSGGIKTVKNALSYMQLTRYMLKNNPNKTKFRIGASQLLNELAP